MAVNVMAARSFDYDNFDFEFDSRPMSLNEAIEEASRLTAADNLHYYRVLPTDGTMRHFRVQKVSKAKEQAKQKANFAARMARAFSH